MLKLPTLILLQLVRTSNVKVEAAKPPETAGRSPLQKFRPTKTGQVFSSEQKLKYYEFNMKFFCRNLFYMSMRLNTPNLRTC